MGYGGYPGYYGGSYSGYTSSYRDTGGLRLKVKPRDAQVLVDGYFVGTVDDFDGVFQRLDLPPEGVRFPTGWLFPEALGPVSPAASRSADHSGDDFADSRREFEAVP